MRITLVLHEAERTGAPRVGGLIAAALKASNDVHVIVMKDGPLVPWLARTIGRRALTVCDDDAFSRNRRFEACAEAAEKRLGAVRGDLVYVNSVAASSFVLAAKKAGRAVVLHIHEKKAELGRLLAQARTKYEVMSLADGAVLAAESIANDVVEVFGILPERVLNFGIAIDVAAVRELSANADTPAKNARGKQIQWGKRLTVGMCGQAAPRKGSDIFLETAAQLPEIDFVWIGGFKAEEAVENREVAAAFEARALPNLYLAGSVDNPYKFLAKLDLFFLSSREDPNPLVLAESMALRVPILCFSSATAVAGLLGRNAIVCFGQSNAPDAVRVLRNLSARQLRADGFRAIADDVVPDFDMKAKIGELSNFLDLVRLSAGS